MKTAVWPIEECKYPWLSKCLQQYDIYDSNAKPSALGIFSKTTRDEAHREEPPSITMKMLHDNFPIAQEIYEKSPKQKVHQNKRSKNEEL